ncbi:MAG: hypothetical protein RLZZ127_758 [Planctomycetota bacterium]|jgi:hypothetical protein
MSPYATALLPALLMALATATTGAVLALPLVVLGSAAGAVLASAAGSLEAFGVRGRSVAPAMAACAGAAVRLGGLLALGASSPILALAAAPAVLAGLIAMPSAARAAIARNTARA